MGFSSSLQGRAAHEALIVRQDAELRLMETMKRSIQLKAKYDREYSIALAAVTQQGLKIDRADDLQGSQITKSWRTYMDELEQQSKLFRSNAELLDTISDKISHLSQDKRKAKKTYQEEHSKIATRLNNLTEEVLRKKTEYQKNLEGYKALRSRFEEHYIKSGRSGRKLDDVRDKYQKACRKLHLTHNEYVLAITEAEEVEKDFRTILLPGLLEHQQSIQESFILLWKNILQETVQHSDLTSDKFKEIQSRIHTVINNINHNEEYREFTEKHKTSPASPIIFQFDENLIEDIPGKLQSNQLTVDNLTIDWLRTRLNELEISIKDLQEKQEKLICDQQLPNGSPRLNGITNGSSSRKENQKQSKDLNSLKCQEKQKLKLADMIKSALNEVGCEELPSGCDDHLGVETNFIETTVLNDQQPSSNISVQSTPPSMSMFRRGAELFRAFPILKRRSMGTTLIGSKSPTTPPPSKYVNRLKIADKPRSQSLNSLAVNKLEIIDSNNIVHSLTTLTEQPSKSLADICSESSNISELDSHYMCVRVVDMIPKQTVKAISVDNLTNSSNNIYARIEISAQNNIEEISSYNMSNIATNQLLTHKNETNCPQHKAASINNLSNVQEKSTFKGKLLITKIKENDFTSAAIGTNIALNQMADIKTTDLKTETSPFIEKQLDKIDEINTLLDQKHVKFLSKIHPETSCGSCLDKITEFNYSDAEIRNSSESKNNSSVDLTEESKNELKSLPVKDIKSEPDKKRSISFYHKSINSLITNIREFKFSHTKIPSQAPIEEKEINKILEEVTELNRLTAEKSAIESSNEMINQEIEKKLKCATLRLRTLEKKVQAKQKRSQVLKNTFRIKFKNLKRSKACEKCSKYAVIEQKKSIFHLNKNHNDRSNNKCVCAVPTNLSNTSNLSNSESSCSLTPVSSSNENIVDFKDHTYCEPFSTGELTYSANRPLYEEEWFHGVLPREEVVRLLKIEGDFLVRETIRNEESQVVLSVCWNGHKHFIVQTTVDGHFRFEGPRFPSIQELIMHQYQSELPVTVKSGAILRKPILRERWELSNDDVMLLEKIGRGNFGDVYKAKLKSTKQDVAVKTCRMTLPDEQKRKFLQEGRILKQYDHTNIVKLIGICVQKQPIMIVMELVPGGSLLNFLRKNSNSLSARQLICMCRDAAAGMRYLESKNCIHRDLAARNCLIDYENSVKISDFGMSREEEEYIVSDGMKQIPVKWTAPEALNYGKYTSLCDVWSYGILMWEIFSKGDTPYSGMSNSRARERIDAGYRMPAPENTPPEMYRLMSNCWLPEPESRPHFEEIFTTLDTAISSLDK